MPPCALLTVITPSATIHCAGDLSFAVTHSSMFLPSNRMIASEGGAAQVAPGVTTFGIGSHISVSSGLVLTCVGAGAPAVACAAGSGEASEIGGRETLAAIRAAYARCREN